MLKTETYLEVHDSKYFKADIQHMDSTQLKGLCSFLEEKELLWVKSHLEDDKQHIIDNILYKI